ncbi:MAG: hypothetical protein V1921_00355 [Candidatus Altiarchaeota archaeon]
MKKKCANVDDDDCTHIELGKGIVVDHPLKEKWGCHTCGYFTPKTPKKK